MNYISEFMSNPKNIAFVFLGLLIFKMVLSFFFDTEDAGESDFEDGVDLSLFSLNGVLGGMSVFFFSVGSGVPLNLSLVYAGLIYVIHHYCVKLPMSKLKQKTEGISEEPHTIRTGDKVQVDVPVSNKKGGRVIYYGRYYDAVLEKENNQKYKVSEELIVIKVKYDKTIIVRKEN